MSCHTCHAVLDLFHMKYPRGTYLPLQIHIHAHDCHYLLVLSTPSLRMLYPYAVYPVRTSSKPLIGPRRPTSHHLQEETKEKKETEGIEGYDFTRHHQLIAPFFHLGERVHTISAARYWPAWARDLLQIAGKGRDLPVQGQGTGKFAWHIVGAGLLHSYGI
jgi:hypothetical protein